VPPDFVRAGEEEIDMASVNQIQHTEVTAHWAANMLNKGLRIAALTHAANGDEQGMTQEFLLAAFIMGVGLCIAGAGTHLYQWVLRQPAMLRYDGKSVFSSFGNLAMSFVCGPYIMLQMGWRHEEGGAISMASMLISALVAFGWAFVTGLLFMSAYVTLRW
jgi:hypothetical protein